MTRNALILPVEVNHMDVEITLDTFRKVSLRNTLRVKESTQTKDFLWLKN